MFKSHDSWAAQTSQGLDSRRSYLWLGLAIPCATMVRAQKKHTTTIAFQMTVSELISMKKVMDGVVVANPHGTPQAVRAWGRAPLTHGLRARDTSSLDLHSCGEGPWRRLGLADCPARSNDSLGPNPPSPPLTSRADSPSKSRCAAESQVKHAAIASRVAPCHALHVDRGYTRRKRNRFIHAVRMRIWHTPISFLHTSCFCFTYGHMLV